MDARQVFDKGSQAVTAAIELSAHWLHVGRLLVIVILAILGLSAGWNVVRDLEVIDGPLASTDVWLRHKLAIGALALVGTAIFAIAVAIVAQLSVSFQFREDYDFDESRLDGQPADRNLATACRDADTEASRGIANGPLESAATASLTAALLQTLGTKAPSSRKELMDAVERVTGWSRADRDRRYQRIKTILEAVQSRISGEYGDIAARIGWLMTAQSFLLGAYVASVGSSIANPGRGFLALSIASVGVIASLVLASAIFFGHALTNRLKVCRDSTEKALQKEFGIPRTGAEVTSEVHRWGHFATKTLAAFSFTTWVLLGNAAWHGVDKVTETPGTLVLSPLSPEVDVSLRLVPFEPSPAFASGAASYDEAARSNECLTEVEAGRFSEDVTRRAKEWQQSFVRRWKSRARPSARDFVLVMGSADRSPLAGAHKVRYDSNLGLARARAEHIRSRLIEAVSDQEPEHRLTEARVLVLITGPAHTPSGRATCVKAAEDRRVQVLLPE